MLMKKIKQYRNKACKKWYTFRKERGMCVSCGSKEINPLSQIVCLICRNKQKEYNLKRKEKALGSGICYRCQKFPIKPGRTSCISCCEKRTKSSVSSKKRLRDAAFTFYGNMCNCCGENNRKFLQIDHVNNDGYKHRQEVKGGAIFRYLKIHNYPDTFQILCSGCNFSKGIHKGCPHKQDPDIVMTPEKFKAMWKVACL